MNEDKLDKIPKERTPTKNEILADKEFARMVKEIFMKESRTKSTYSSLTPGAQERMREENEGLLVKLNAYQDIETKEWIIGVSGSIRIPIRDISTISKAELISTIIKKLGAIRKVLDKKLKN